MDLTVDLEDGVAAEDHRVLLDVRRDVLALGSGEQERDVGRLEIAEARTGVGLHRGLVDVADADVGRDPDLSEEARPGGGGGGKDDGHGAHAATVPR